jgi:hypothetical protein
MDSSSITNHSLQGCFLGMLNRDRGVHHGRNRETKQPKIDFDSLSPNEMDRIIAKEMTELSLQERIRAEEDVQ